MPMKLKLIQSLLLIMTLNASNFAAALELQLPACKQSPNCVSTQAEDASHFVAPFKIKSNPDAAWQGLRQAILATDRMIIIEENSTMLHAEATSRIFRFVDDIYAILDAEKLFLHLYSASRKGYSDFGVNRARVEKLREKLREAGLVE